MTSDPSGSALSVSVGDRTLHVVDIAGPPAAVPVVLLHGGGPGATGTGAWSRNARALAAHRRVIVPDLPGYGRSTKRVDPTDPFGDLAVAVGGLLDALAVPRAHLVGSSYGGAAALRLAMDRPASVDRLVLVAPGGIGTTRTLPTKGLSALLGYYTGEGPTRDKLARFLRHHLVADGSSIPEEVIDARFAASLDPEVVASPPLRRPRGRHALRTLWRMDLTRDRRLSQVTAPTLVMWGAADRVNRPSGAARLAAALPRCDVWIAADTGHWLPWERADSFNALTNAFLAEAH